MLPGVGVAVGTGVAVSVGRSVAVAVGLGAGVSVGASVGDKAVAVAAGVPVAWRGVVTSVGATGVAATAGADAPHPESNIAARRMGIRKKIGVRECFISDGRMKDNDRSRKHPHKTLAT